MYSEKLAQGFNTAAQDSNPGSRSRESEALSLSHCALHNSTHVTVVYYINMSNECGPDASCRRTCVGNGEADFYVGRMEWDVFGKLGQ